MSRRLAFRLHRDERGFLSPMIVFMLVALAYMIVWILNTGQVIYDKQRTQDTADAAALVHADWAARSLNVMSMNNVASSQATVVMATSAAYAWTLTELIARSTTIVAQLVRYIGAKGWGRPALVLPTGAPYCILYKPIPVIGPVVFAACAAYQGFRMTEAVVAFGYANKAMWVTYKPLSIASKASDIITAMNKMNDALVDDFPDRTGREALNLVRVNDADHLVFHPACRTAKSCRRSTEGQGSDLPVEKGLMGRGLAYVEMCSAMSSGTLSFGARPFAVETRSEFANRGFAAGKGPLTGGGSAARPHIRDHVNDEGGTSVRLPAFHVFYEAVGPAYYTTIPFKDIIKKYRGKAKVTFLGFDVTDKAIDVGFFLIEKLIGIKIGFLNPFQLPIDKPWPRYKDTQTETENDFTRKFNQTWNQVCGVGGGALTVLQKLVPDLNLLPSPYWLKGRPPTTLTILDAGVSRSRAADQMTGYRTLAAVSRKPRARLQTGRFEDKAPSAFAFAEGWVHNYTAFDLYTQDWLAVLVPNSLLGNAGAVSRTIANSPAAGSYRTLTNALEKGGSNGWSSVNNH